MSGSTVATRLRPASPAEQRTLHRWREQVLSPFDDFRGAPPAGLRVTVVAPPGGSGELAVTDGDDRLLGGVGWRPVTHGPNAGSQALEIGITLHATARGRGHGGRAQRMLAEQLFATTGVHRVQASTDVENLAEQRALERAGFVREGLLRGAQWRLGAFHDLVGYARLRTDRVPETAPYAPATGAPPGA